MGLVKNIDFPFEVCAEYSAATIREYFTKNIGVKLIFQEGIKEYL